MSPDEVADLLEGYASAIRRLPGVSRTNPHAFTEAKSDLAGALMRQARDLRAVPPPPNKPVGMIRPGTRTIGRREVAVERRRRA